MTIHNRQFLIALFVCLAPLRAFAAPSAELTQVMADVLAWVPGAYDSAPQIAYEQANGAPPSGEHDHQFRVFARITAPHLGEHVFYSQIRVGGADGPVIQQVVFLIDFDEKNNGVKFNGRRIKDPENFVDAHKDPSKWATIAPDPKFGGNCDFFWRRHGALLKGTLNDGTCTMVSRNTNQRMTWKTEWVLGLSELWVTDNGYYDDGTLVTGRADKSHLRLYKANSFSCTATLPSSKAKAGAPSVITQRVHDRGGFAQVREPVGKTPPLFVELMRGPSVSADGQVTETSRLSLYDREPADGATAQAIAQASADGAPQHLSLRTAAADVACTRQAEIPW